MQRDEQCETDAKDKQRYQEMAVRKDGPEFFKEGHRCLGAARVELAQP
jgi:hypothetical protein